MANPIVKEMIEAGVHFGHRTSLWNPKMGPYIFGKKNRIYILDIRETLRGMLRAKKYLSQIAAGGSLVLFVGTKRQAGEAIEQQALRCGMPFVSERWLGGTLTNFRTIRSRLSRLEELEELRGSEKLNDYSKKMQSSLNREYRKMYRLEWFAIDEPAARVFVHCRSGQRTQCGSRGKATRHHHRCPDRYR